MAEEFIKLLENGIVANKQDKYRKVNLIVLPQAGDVVIAGDIHGHRRNFERIVSYANLEENPERHLILQEIIHGGPEDEKGGCLSFEVLADAVKLKIDYPDRVHFILANHDTAFINNSDVMKNGKEMNTAMRAAMQRRFGEDVQKLESAIERFLFSQPLAVRCPNRIWISHSLPSDRMVEKFDFTIFDRALKISDIVRPNSAYLLTWGRGQSSKSLRFLAQQLDIDLFVLGHQVQETGWMSNDENLVIIDSQHNHGHLLRIDLTAQYTIKKLVDSLIPIASIY
ncbi:MAG: metallophosphoesterase [Planctomycetes bacterium]|nr:metallophosphoesterase [Planctomycetota bacterium]MBU2457562.1 metallophosphoesterase [Planctomycetota bacterium]MBU2597056.1 metallophosphoesterase [Planctomycetota bacterium]